MKPTDAVIEIIKIIAAESGITITDEEAIEAYEICSEEAVGEELYDRLHEYFLD